MAFSGVNNVNEMDELINDMNYMYVENVEDKKTDLISHINSLKDLEQGIKTMLINLIKNDSHDSYVDIYNICQENDIELPPLY